MKYLFISIFCSEFLFVYHLCLVMNNAIENICTTYNRTNLHIVIPQNTNQNCQCCLLVAIEHNLYDV